MRFRSGVAGGIAAGLLVALGAAAPKLLALREAAACTASLEERRFPDAVEACTRAFERDRRGRFAASVAMGLLGMGKPEEAWRWATLPEAEDEVRARRVRGVVLNSRRDIARAKQELEHALTLALERGEAGEAARAAHALAGIQWEQGQYSAAWDSLEVSEREARRAGDGPALALAELARGDVLRKIGDAQRAETYYRRAIASSAAWPADQAYALFKSGLWFRDRRALGLARADLERALTLATKTRNRPIVNAAQNILAEVLIDQGQIELAERYLVDLDTDWGVQLTHARIALARRDAEKALERLREVERTPLDPDFAWQVEALRAEAFNIEGNRAEAEAAWMRAIAIIETLSTQEPEHQGWVVARRRAPYDALFQSLADRGAHAEAWRVLARYSLSEALSFTQAEAEDPRPLFAAAEALKAEWNVRRPEPGIDLDAAPVAGEILVLHEAGDRLWVGTRRSALPRFTAVAHAEVGPLLHRFLGDPGDRKAADALGQILWDAAALEPSTEPVYVMATGRLRRLALAALRETGQYWFERRPLARLPSLVAPKQASSKTTSEPTGPLVVGDARGDLSSARDELAWVAQRFGVQPRLGAAATRDSVLGSHGSALLHIATHASIGLDGARLQLADGELTTEEVLRHRVRADLVVLASCASAVGREAAGSDSLATAFLRAGSGAVLGTLRTVPDAASHQLVRAFYEHGGEKDPITALARAQADVAPTLAPSIWSSFVVSVGPSWAGPGASR